MDHDGFDGNDELAAEDDHLRNTDLNHALVPRGLAATPKLGHMIRSPVFEVVDDVAMDLVDRAHSPGAPIYYDPNQPEVMSQRKWRQTFAAIVEIAERHRFSAIRKSDRLNRQQQQLDES